MPYTGTEKQKEYSRKYMAEWRAKHPDRAANIAKQYRSNHINECKARDRSYRDRHKTKVEANLKRWLAEHPEYKEKRNSMARAEYEKRIAAGLCGRCGDIARSGYTRCTPCATQNGVVCRKWSKANQRRYNLKKVYGITLEQWEALFESQGRCCGLCVSDKAGTNGWQTDHDHDTGRVRAILCGPCNLGLGCFKDNTDLMAKAIDYIRKHKLALVG